MTKVSDLIVSKFGGSVLKDANAFRDAANYLSGRNAVAVVSAMQGFTNVFKNAYETANSGKYMSGFSPAKTYMEVIDTLPSGLKQTAAVEMTGELGLLKIYAKIGARDAFIGSSEGHSAILLKYHLMALGKDVIHLTGPDAGFYLNGHGLVDMEKSREHLESVVGDKLKSGQRVVVGGYLGIGTDDSAEHVKLGARNINDAFAPALADALGAAVVEIIKDVPGVYRVPPVFGDYGLLNVISYDEARKMSWRGSPVVHPSAIRIAQNRNIPMIVKTMDSEGTKISVASQTNLRKPVAALVAERMRMVSVRDDIMDTPEGRGYLAAIYRFEKNYGVDIITDATDFSGISYTAMLGDRKDSNRSAEVIFGEHNEKLAEHLRSLGYKPVVDGEEVGVITAVGDCMQNKPGVLSQITAIPAARGISIRSAVQSDEKYAPPSITLVVDSDKLEMTVKALAEDLFA
ncbi:MAG: hypothetical protein V1836_00635 [Candidatus Aenigmatarchaeota archaeon]